MTTLNSYDKLIEYPKEKGLVFETHRDEKKFLVSTSDRILNTKYVAFEKDSLLFLAYDSFASRGLMSQTFTGVFKIFHNNIDSEISIFKRDWSDNIFRRNRKKVNDKYVDRNLTIICKKSKMNFDCLDETFVNNYLALNNIISPLELLIRYDYLGFLSNYENKHIIGIETNQWISNHQEVDELINKGEILIDKIITNTCG